MEGKYNTDILLTIIFVSNNKNVYPIFICEQFPHCLKQRNLETNTGLYDGIFNLTRNVSSKQ